MLPSFAFPTPSQWTDFLERFPDEAPAPETTVTLSDDDRAAIEQVNREVNALGYIHEAVGDVWGLAGDGSDLDCDNLALEKRHRLRAFLPVGALAPTICRLSLGLNALVDHLVLVVRTTEGDLVLDNMTDQLIPAENYPCETWVASLYGERWRMVS